MPLGARPGRHELMAAALGPGDHGAGLLEVAGRDCRHDALAVGDRPHLCTELSSQVFKHDSLHSAARRMGLSTSTQAAPVA
ncbi:MAG: hypothetical protein AMXMBFR83_13320 [Phycisphaerae bacterium]